MKFIVHSEESIQDFKTDLTHVVISIRSNGAKQIELPYVESRIGTLFLEFPDWDEAPKNYPHPLFSQQQAETILLFVEGLKGIVDLVVCQCEAGISRSAGVAGALNLIYNGNDEEFFRFYLPNRRVYRLLLETYYGKGM
jgi:predicted protein tyrosine phosphatase